MFQKSNLREALPGSEFVQTLEKGLQVICCFNEETPTRTLADVAKAVGLTRAAARRLVLTLEVLGYVERSGKAFRLSPRILELGYSYLASQPWWRHAQTVINEAGKHMGCACAVGVLDRDCVAYVAYTPGGDTPHVLRSIGTRLPATATALGRVLLAHQDPDEVRAQLLASPPARLTPFSLVAPDELALELARARQQGYASVYQQLEIGLFSVGVPVYDRAHNVLAAISASVWRREPDAVTLDAEFLGPLRAASESITAGLPF
ncbi:MAG: helix-turn-helix domain-containing protein [Beijerinckiaceae bacterium]|nr:helix-turn-helix domain-containing protein [Beijerinckiaceae bacterium]